MARGVNKVIIVGNLGADPDTKSMPSGNMVANLVLQHLNHGMTGIQAKDKRRQSGTEWSFLEDWRR